MLRAFSTVLAVLTLLAAGAPAQAWGPFTHAAIGRQVLAKLEHEPDPRLDWLRSEPARTLFIAASMGPDLTFSVTGFGKTDRKLDRLMHDLELGPAMLRDALARGDGEQVAFALGWHSHILADHVMCRPGGVIYRNVFELEGETLEKLGGDMAGLLKVTIDASLGREDPTLLTTLARFEIPLLARGLQEMRSAGLPATGSDLEALLRERGASFSGALGTLREICRSLSANSRAFPELVAQLERNLGGEVSVVPGIAESAEEVLQNLRRMMPAGFEAGGAGGDPVPPGERRGMLDRATASLMRRSRSLVAGRGYVSRLYRGLIGGVLDGMNALGVASGRTRRARFMATFLGEMISGSKEWPEVKAAVRAVAEEARPTAEEDAGFSELLYSSGE